MPEVQRITLEFVIGWPSLVGQTFVNCMAACLIVYPNSTTTGLDDAGGFTHTFTFPHVLPELSAEISGCITTPFTSTTCSGLMVCSEPTQMTRERHFPVENGNFIRSSTTYVQSSSSRVMFTLYSHTKLEASVLSFGLSSPEHCAQTCRANHTNGNTQTQTDLELIETVGRLPATTIPP